MGTNTVDPNAGPPQLEAAVKTVMQGMGMLYKEAHAADPSGQATQAIQQIMQAISEVANSMAQGGQQAPAGPQDPFAQASQNVQAQMAQPQGPSPY